MLAQILTGPYIPPKCLCTVMSVFHICGGLMKFMHSITSQLGLCTWWCFAPEKSFKGLQHCAVTDQEKSKTDSAPESVRFNGSGLHLYSILNILSRISLMQITPHNEVLNVHKSENFSHSLTVHHEFKIP